MKFSTFFGKFNLCCLIWGAISIVVTIVTCGTCYLVAKKSLEKETEEEEKYPIIADDMNLDNTK